MVHTRSSVKAVGSRAQVWHGTAHHTSGGVTKAGLKQPAGKGGALVSKAASAASKRRLGKMVHVRGQGRMSVRAMLNINKIPKKSRRKSRKGRKSRKSRR